MKKENEILSLEEAKKKAIYCRSYDNGDYEYRTKGSYSHLIRDNKDLLEGKKAVYCCSYDNGDYEYKAENGYWHLIRNGKDLLEGKKAIWCHSYNNGDYEYRTENGYYHLIRDGKNLLENKKAVYYYSYKNGDYEYRTECGKSFYIKNNSLESKNNSLESNSKVYSEIAKIKQNRQQMHGAAKANFKMISRLWSAYTGVKIDSKDVGFMMAMLKAARHKGGDKNNLDNFVDAANYIALAGDF